VTGAGSSGAYILPSRDLIANDIEVAVEGALLDGMLCLASCDKTAPGQLMAAGRLDVPTIVVACGYQRSGSFRGQHCDIEDVFLHSTAVTSGRMGLEELGEMADAAVCGPGVCPGMGTANSMHVATEALGMALSGSTPIAADSDRLRDVVRRAGARIVELVSDDVRPRAVLTPGAFRNAAAVVLALSGSHNCFKHLQAVAAEAEANVDMYAVFTKLADQVPLLAAIRPSGQHLIEDLDDAGGARAVLKRLQGLLDLDTPTVDGRTMGELLAGVDVADDRVVRTVADPVSRRPAIIIVRGSLLPGGGIVRLGGGGARPTRFAGTARVFVSREAALAAIDDGGVRAGDVVVLRGLGVRGAPGMAFTSSVVFSLETVGLLHEVALITEGQISGLVNRGIVVGEASPEAAEGGPLAYVRDGDPIVIDLDARRVDLDVAGADLAARRPWTPQRRRAHAGWLAIYEQTVGPVHEGAILGRSPDRLPDRPTPGTAA
jgi:dihydroxy-acid dehydratase